VHYIIYNYANVRNKAEDVSPFSAYIARARAYIYIYIYIYISQHNLMLPFYFWGNLNRD